VSAADLAVIVSDFSINKKPCYRKDDRAMRPIAYGCSEKNCESLATPTANFPDILMDLFQSIRKKSCGSGSADNRVRTLFVQCDAGISRYHAGPAIGSWNKAYL